MTAQPTLVIHGGAENRLRQRFTPDELAGLRRGLGAALRAGQAVLLAGGAALDAVEAAVRVLEDDPLFNAGRGGALTRDGTVELDAAIMDGSGGGAGGAIGLTRIRHPVTAARKVMERSGHVLMHGPGAEAFALAEGCDAAEPQWFVTPYARRALALWKGDGVMRGTVGAVALDRAGRLAAATSTGGLSGKRPGRIGDCPIPGAGTWADARVAVSATGDGEAFLRAGFAHRIAMAVESGREAGSAAGEALELVRTRGGTGGAIILASDGGWWHRHTSDDLNRGVAVGAGEPLVAVLGDEPLAPAPA